MIIQACYMGLKTFLLILILLSCKETAGSKITAIDNDILYLNQRLHLKSQNETTLVINGEKIFMLKADSITNVVIHQGEGKNKILVETKMEINRSGKYIKFGDIYFPLLKHKEK